MQSDRDNKSNVTLIHMRGALIDTTGNPIIPSISRQQECQALANKRDVNFVSDLHQVSQPSKCKDMEAELVCLTCCWLLFSFCLS